MPDTNLANSAIIATYRERTPRSVALVEEAMVLLVLGGRASCPQREMSASYSPMSSSAYAKTAGLPPVWMKTTVSPLPMRPLRTWSIKPDMAFEE